MVGQSLCTSGNFKSNIVSRDGCGPNILSSGLGREVFCLLWPERAGSDLKILPIEDKNLAIFNPFAKKLSGSNWFGTLFTGGSSQLLGQVIAHLQ